MEINFNRLELEEGEIGRNIVLQGDGEIVKTGIGRADLNFGFNSEYSGTVTVQDGFLSSSNRDELALFRVEGGELQVTAGSDLRQPQLANTNRIELAGGDLTIFGSTGTRQGLSGSIAITEDSRISLTDDVFLDAELTGTGDLEFVGATLFDSGRRSLEVRNANERYSGDVTIGFEVDATLSHTDSLGTGSLTVADGGSIRFFSAFEGDFVNGQPTAIFSRAITLDNGSILGATSNNIPVLANVAVEGFSSIRDFSNIENLSLSNQSRLTLHGSSTISRLEVVGEAELEFGLLEPAGRIEATVFSGATTSVLDLQDRRLVDTELSLSYNVQFGQSLEVLSDGQSIDLFVEQGQRLSGSGTLVNSVTILNGGVISPGGEFADMLTVDGSLTLGEDSIYEFDGFFDATDIDGLLGMFSTDFLSISDNLIFGATEDQPFILDFGGDESFLSLINGDERFSFNIASANGIIGFDETAVQFRGIEAGTRLSLQSDGRNLILTTAVPEPSSVFVFIGLSIALLSRRSRQ